MISFLKGKNVLITGGSGSIGKALAKRALADGAKIVKIFSNDEYGQYELEKEFENDKRLRFFIGDIRNENSIDYVTKGSNIVFHTAALKHVDRCESNPFEAVTVNILGTKNVISSALKESVERVVSISTDKAVNPVSVLGGTKLLTEKLISAEAFRSDNNNNTIFSSVRFGNVLNTRGSILPQIEKQIQDGGPITLTDKKMMRYFMTEEDAVNLIISATRIAKGGEIFVLKMSLLRLEDLFEAMKNVLAPKYGFKPSQIKTKVIGMRAGEKLIEELITEFEIQRSLEMKDFFIIFPHKKPDEIIERSDAKKPKNLKTFFEGNTPLKRQEIERVLRKIYQK